MKGTRRFIRPSPLRVRRLRLGMRLQDVSDATGLSVSQLSLMERGMRTLTRKSYNKITRAFIRSKTS